MLTKPNSVSVEVVQTVYCTATREKEKLLAEIFIRVNVVHWAYPPTEPEHVLTGTGCDECL